MKRIFFLILLAVMSTGIYAQTDDKGYKEGDITASNIKKNIRFISVLFFSSLIYKTS